MITIDEQSLISSGRVLATPSLLLEHGLTEAPAPTLQLPNAIAQLTEGDPDLLARLTTVHEVFAGLVLPMGALPESEARQLVADRAATSHLFVVQSGENIAAAPDFDQGADYQFGRYQGKPSSIRENAAAAIYEGEQGAELWRMLKSVAFDAGNGAIVIAHMRGDRNVSEQLLLSRLGDLATQLKPADLSVLGTEHGVVNPFLTSTNPGIEIRHIFDNDLIAGPEHPRDDIVIASTGDKRVYCWFDIRKYLVAIYKVRGPSFAPVITETPKGKGRQAVRRPIIVLGGDSASDTSAFEGQIKDALVHRLKAEELLFGDRSLPDIRSCSLSDMGATADVSSAPRVLRLVGSELSRLVPANQSEGEPIPVLAMGSNMGSGMVEAALRGQTRVEFVGVNQVVDGHIRELTDSLNQAGNDVSGILLLGLPGVYDLESSPFPSLLNPDETAGAPTFQIGRKMQERLGALVFKGKYRTAEVVEFYQIVQQATRHNRVSPQSSDAASAVIVVLGATELETLASSDHQPPKNFQVLPSDQIKTGTLPDTGKLNIILVKPQALVAQTVAALAANIGTPRPVIPQPQAAGSGGHAIGGIA